ncbi:MAG: hypothetical protein M1831_001406 [Alyxoria varia]|nr:MAG: hypothetical protein M1831_001406 [Alyxoria varia]
MNSLDTHSSLVSLVLFQSLAVHGTARESFDQISASLNQSSLFQQESDQHDNRLDAESLKDFYIRLIKEAAKAKLERERERETSPSKRKALSPKLPNIEEASKYNALVPDLIPSLYARYRDLIIRDIKEEERKYDSLVQEIQSLRESAKAHVEAEAAPGPPEAREAHEVPSKVNGDFRPPAQKASPLRSPKETHAKVQDGASSTERKDEAPSAKAKTKSRSANTSISSIINHEPPDDGPPRPTFPDTARHASSQSPRKEPTPQGTSPSAIAPSAPGAPAPPSNHHPPPAIQPYHPISPYAHSDPRHGPSPTSTSQNPPRILPPPRGMNTFPPTSPWSTTSDSSFQTRQHPPPNSPIHHLPNHNYTHEQPPVDHRQMHSGQYQSAMPQTWRGPPQSPAGPQRPPHFYPYQDHHLYQHANPKHGGFVLPPFSVAPQSSIPSQRSPVSSRPAPSTQRPPPAQAQNVPEPAPIRPQQTVEPPKFHTPGHPSNATPLSAPHTTRLTRPGVTVSPGSLTSWKVGDAPSPARPLEIPQRRSVSPISDSERIPRRRSAPQPNGSSRLRKSMSSSTARPPKKPVLGQKDRPENITTTQPGASPSLPSDVADPPASATRGARKKANNSSVTFPEKKEDNAIKEGTTNLKGGTSTKRKRSDVGNASPEQSAPSPVQPPNTIVASRNFNKMATPILNIISSHKHASLFANPVRERDAEGYTSIIRRPQDLKSIRAAINAGSRAVAAATANEQPQPSPSAGTSGGGSSGTVTLPVSEALIPPKGIVNAAQLEQEVMRMFANAVMFNPGDEGVVRDTREMFETVQQSLSSWRSAETLEDMGPGEEDLLASSGSKRRKT